ncbi:hypothetical protein [Streptomyces sp. LaPpAH-108]|uniref:hypothetical protein n=1 Tax=Streptomyces sp. LaPpAH-108 TaxID=1155714 RepID=UPI00037D2676|nr:hypothetical protein [Streptomyces sp. LaPpAH-108]
MPDETVLFPLPHGATGLFRPQDGPLPETDPRAFRAALHAAARAGGGRVGEVVEQAYPRTYHAATVVDRAGEWTVLCHAHHPWIAFADGLRDTCVSGFREPSEWARAFCGAGFTVLDADRLALPLSRVDTSVLTEGEWHGIRFYGVTTLGEVLFNSWD